MTTRVPLADQLGQVAYEAYAQAVGMRSVTGSELPAWERIPERIRAGWLAAASAVTAAFVEHQKGNHATRTEPE